jgi:CRISPR-associated exonuclease Cas4
MRIKEIHIENFRSIRKLDINCKEFNILVGRNSVGKSNVLLALDVFFNTSDKILSEDMFCSFSEIKDIIVIELTFDNLTEAEKNGRLKKYVCTSLGAGIKVRKNIDRIGNKLKSRYQGYVEEPTIEWLKSDFKGYGKISYWQEQGVDIFKYTKESGGRITSDRFDEFRKNYIESNIKDLHFETTLSETDFEGLKTVGIDMLPQFKLIPAVGDVSDVVAGTSKSLLTRVVQDVLRAVTTDVGILKEAKEGLDGAAALINRGSDGHRLKQIDAIEEWFRKEFFEWGKLDFELHTSFPEIHTLLTEKLQLIVDDGAKGDASTKGHGLQRQLIFKVIRLSAALLEGDVDWIGLQGSLPETIPMILAFEEPELYLHPQAQLAFYEDIKKLSSRDQIFLCTHSPYLVDLENYEGVKILKRDTYSSPTLIYECAKNIWEDLPLKKKLALAKLFDANVNKIFFADKIVIVEGDEDVIAITQTAKDHAKCFKHRVTIVNAGGKERIPALQRVLNAFKVPYTVVYDVDPGNPTSKKTSDRIEELVGELSAFGLAASMPMDPDLATIVGYGDTKAEKDAACVKFFEDSTPTSEFITKVQTLYDIPHAGILTPS